MKQTIGTFVVTLAVCGLSHAASSATDATIPSANKGARQQTSTSRVTTSIGPMAPGGKPGVRTNGAGCELVPDDLANGNCGSVSNLSFEYPYQNAGGGWALAEVFLETVYVSGRRVGCTVGVQTSNGGISSNCEDLRVSVDFESIGINAEGKEGIGGAVDAMTGENPPTQPPCPSEGASAIGTSGAGRPKTQSDDLPSCPSPRRDTYQRCVAAAVALLNAAVNNCYRRFPNGNIIDWANREDCLIAAQYQYKDDRKECDREFPNR